MPATGYLEVAHLSIKDITRIFSYIRIDPVTDCWIWTGNRNADDYGLIWFRGKTEHAHRVLYAWTVERLPRRQQKGSHRNIPELDHFTCDNPPCCNPVHMKLVPHRINILRSKTCTSAINARKQYCIRGHELPLRAPNTKQRTCSECRPINTKERWHGPKHDELLEIARVAGRKRWNGPRHQELLERQRKRQDTEKSRQYHREYIKAYRKRQKEKIKS